ncbi:MAG: hypothetical protein D6814_17605, partial [Calditrichaeota bacterium]
MRRLSQIFLWAGVCSLFLLFSFQRLQGQSSLDCSQCHKEIVNLWQTGRHANTQDDVAEELAEEWAGLPPDSVILGQEAENCIACHAPLAARVGMGHFRRQGRAGNQPFEPGMLHQVI